MIEMITYVQKCCFSELNHMFVLECSAVWLLNTTSKTAEPWFGTCWADWPVGLVWKSPSFTFQFLDTSETNHLKKNPYSSKYTVLSSDHINTIHCKIRFTAFTRDQINCLASSVVCQTMSVSELSQPHFFYSCHFCLYNNRQCDESLVRKKTVSKCIEFSLLMRGRQHLELVYMWDTDKLNGKRSAIIQRLFLL